MPELYLEIKLYNNLHITSYRHSMLTNLATNNAVISEILESSFTYDLLDINKCVRRRVGVRACVCVYIFII